MKRIALLGMLGWVVGVWTMLLSVLIEWPKGFNLGATAMLVGCLCMGVELCAAHVKTPIDRQRVR